MRTQRKKVAITILTLLVGSAACGWGDVAVTVDPAVIDWVSIDQEASRGYRFYIDKPIVITHLGLFDSIDGPGTQNGPGLVGTHTVALWRLPKTGGFDLKAQVTIGPGAELSDHQAWAALAEPVTITPDPVPNYINGVAYYERWMVGVWTPNYLGPGVLGDALTFMPQSAVTFDAVQAGVMRFDAYTYRASAPSFVPPWPASPYSFHYGVNFKYHLVGPSAEAGPNVAIYTAQQATTTVVGAAGDTNPNAVLQYRWLEGDTVLQDWTTVGWLGTAGLSLAAPVPALSLGDHTLTLEVSDGAATASDTMTLTVENTPPVGQPTPTDQVLQIGVDPIIIGASVADFDGDTLYYRWIKDALELGSGTITPPAGGAAVAIDDLRIDAGDSRFSLNSDNEVQLEVSDGKNPPQFATVMVHLKDTQAPTLSPVPSLTMLWPANHEMVPVTIATNAADNGGGPVALAASVQCNESSNGTGDGSTSTDCTITSIDNLAGTVLVQLRAERSGTGDGRVYTITITASDASGNHSTATVAVRVPHDQKKK